MYSKVGMMNECVAYPVIASCFRPPIFPLMVQHAWAELGQPCQKSFVCLCSLNVIIILSTHLFNQKVIVGFIKLETCFAA